MTTDLEKKFFSTFGIEPFIYCSKPRLDCDARSKGTCRKDCEYYSGVLYPQITDTHYLQLICQLSGVCCPHFAFERDISELKETILKFCIYYKDHLEKSVQALFKDER